jgi:hypothetical protein
VPLTAGGRVEDRADLLPVLAPGIPLVEAALGLSRRPALGWGSVLLSVPPPPDGGGCDCLGLGGRRGTPPAPVLTPDGTGKKLLVVGLGRPASNDVSAPVDDEAADARLPLPLGSDRSESVLPMEPREPTERCEPRCVICRQIEDGQTQREKRLLIAKCTRYSVIT